MDSKEPKSNGAVATGMIAAIAASSCCIPPVIAAVAGIGGAAGSLSWIEPFRPYLIGITVVAIGYAWYNHIKPKQADDCGCDLEKPKWFQTKGFLILVTLFAIVSIAFPYYSGFLFPDNRKTATISSSANIETITVNIDGMTCEACQNHVNHAVNELPGIINVNTSYDQENAVIEFDINQTDRIEIEEAINSTGYSVLKEK